jgi:hypothetical protein
MIFEVDAEARFQRGGAGADDADAAFDCSGGEDVEAEPGFVEAGALGLREVDGADYA